jgi:hypothetical protein
MIISIHQPDFIPWLGFFNKASLSDLLVIGDHVQYRNKGYQNRNRIKTNKGWQWLTVPIIHNWGQPINEVKIQNKEQNGIAWQEQHLRTLQVNYGKAPFYDKYIEAFEKIYRKQYELLVDLNLDLLNVLFDILEIHIKIEQTSKMTLTQSKTELIIEICKNYRADSYLSGGKGAAYMDESLFPQNGIELLYNNYEHPTYNQQFMQFGFLPNMSVIDLIFNHGQESIEIIKKGFRGFYDKPSVKRNPMADITPTMAVMATGREDNDDTPPD